MRRKSSDLLKKSFLNISIVNRIGNSRDFYEELKESVCKFSYISNRSRKMKDNETKLLCRQISGMLKSGCNIITVFDTIIESSDLKISYILSIVKKGILNGKNLTEAFAISNAFPNFFIKMVYAGERSGEIDYVFEKLAQYYEREDRVKSKLFNVSIYPIILLIVLFIASNIIFVFAIPDFIAAFDFDGLELPLLSRIVFKISNLLRKNAILIYLIIFSTIFIFIRTIKSSISFKIWIDEKKFKKIKIKKISELILSERVSRVLFILLGSGIHITEAMDIAIETISNSYAERKLKIAAKNIEEGNSLSISFQSIDIFPKSFISMIRSGEESGNFDKSLEESSIYYRDELDKQIDRFIRLIEPTMIIIMGLVIALGMISVVYPMVSIISTIS